MRAPFVLLMLISTATFAQITTTKVAKERVVFEPYDSTKNILIDQDVYQYIGQVFYLKGEPKMSTIRTIGYSDVCEDYQNYSSFKSIAYEELAEKYFKVTSVKILETESGYENIFIEIEEEESKKVFYYKYFWSKFPFIVVGYFQKLKNDNIGKKVIVTGDNWHSNFPALIDMNTGRDVRIEKGQVWTLINLTIEEEFYELSIVIRNNDQEQLLLPIEESYRLGFYDFTEQFFRSYLSNYLKRKF